MDMPPHLDLGSIQLTVERHRMQVDHHTALAQAAATDSASCSEIYGKVVVEQDD